MMSQANTDPPIRRDQAIEMIKKEFAIIHGHVRVYGKTGALRRAKARLSLEAFKMRHEGDVATAAWTQMCRTIKESSMELRGESREPEHAKTLIADCIGILREVLK